MGLVVRNITTINEVVEGMVEALFIAE